MLEGHAVEAQSRFIDVPLIGGRTHVLVSAEGPAVPMVNGTGMPGAMSGPLMAELDGFRFFVLDLPGYGLTYLTARFAEDLRRNVVCFLNEVLDGLELERPASWPIRSGRSGPVGGASRWRA